MPKQPAFPGLRDAMKKKVTRRERFLAEMEVVVPWGRLLALIAPHYPKAGLNKDGRPPMPLGTMLRVYFLQNWYALSDPMAEETLYDSEAMRRFAGIEPGDEHIPDETTILNFRHLLERHGLMACSCPHITACIHDVNPQRLDFCNDAILRSSFPDFKKPPKSMTITCWNFLFYHSNQRYKYWAIKFFRIIVF